MRSEWGVLGVGASVDRLIPFYAVGVFTGFTLAGFGMAKYHTIHKEQGWKKKWWINASGGALSLAIVLITAVVKFSEGAWLVLVLSFGAIFLLLYLIRHGAATRVASLFYLVPPTTALMAWPLFGESYSALAAAGMGLGMLAVWLVTKP